MPNIHNVLTPFDSTEIPFMLSFVLMVTQQAAQVESLKVASTNPIFIIILVALHSCLEPKKKLLPLDRRVSPARKDGTVSH